MKIHTTVYLAKSAATLCGTTVIVIVYFVKEHQSLIKSYGQHIENLMLAKLFIESICLKRNLVSRKTITNKC
jgi:hypothetical protein